MSNFTPIVDGAPADAAIVNAPLYELDSAITILQTSGAINAARPWGIATLFGLVQPTSSDPVTVFDDIAHIGKLVRGAANLSSTGADTELRGNLAVGSGNHSLYGTSGLASGTQNTVGDFGLAAGQQNAASGNNAFAVGTSNVAAATNSMVHGATSTITSGSDNAVISGGSTHQILNSSLHSGIGAGLGNQISASSQAFIGGGGGNFIQQAANYSVIGGGNANNTFNSALSSFTGAGSQNLMGSGQSFIGAGYRNQVHAGYVFIGAGQENQVYGTNAAIGGGQANRIISSYTDSYDSFIGGGGTNTITDAVYAFIGAGYGGTIGSGYSGIVAGRQNSIGIDSGYSGIVAGLQNSIGIGGYNFIGSGSENAISSASSNMIGAGFRNTISNAQSAAIIAGETNTVTGNLSTVLNGTNNVINGFGSAAGGTDGHVTHAYAFMWNSYNGSTFASTANGEFAVTAYGGIRLFSNSIRTTGMTLPAGTSSWVAVSARAVKGEFTDIEQRTVLDRLLAVPIQSYRFKNANGGYHDPVNFGPVAEDWNSAFGDLFGEKTVINMVDGAEVRYPAISEGDKLGVALAAIQGLASLVNEMKFEIATLNSRLN